MPPDCLVRFNPGSVWELYIGQGASLATVGKDDRQWTKEISYSSLNLAIHARKEETRDRDGFTLAAVGGVCSRMRVFERSVSKLCAKRMAADSVDSCLTKGKWQNRCARRMF